MDRLILILVFLISTQLANAQNWYLKEFGTPAVRFWQFDTTLNNYSSLRGTLNGVHFVRADQSNENTTYTNLGLTSFGFMTGNSGFNSIYLGGHAGQSTTIGGQRTVVGNRALVHNTIGDRLTVVGQGAGYNNVNGSDFTLVGFHSGLNVLGSNLTSVGARAMEGASNANPSSCIAVGNNALQSIVDAQQCGALGVNSLKYLTTAYNTWAMGHWAGVWNTTGSDNIFIGSFSGATSQNLGTTIGRGNTFVGNYTGQSTSTQVNFSGAIGYEAKVKSDSTFIVGAKFMRVGIGSDYANYKLHVHGSAAITYMPVSTSQSDSIVVKTPPGELKTIPQPLTSSVNIDFPNTTPSNNSRVSVNITGVAVGQPVFLGYSYLPANCYYTAFIAQNNIVTVVCHNYGTVAIDPPNTNYKIIVKR